VLTAKNEPFLKWFKFDHKISVMAIFQDGGYS